MSRADTHVELRRARHPQRQILLKLFWPRLSQTDEAELNATGFGKFVGYASYEALLTTRVARLERNEKDQLCGAVRWAIDRLEATCIPPSRPNPGRRTTARWAHGFLDGILAAKVIEALWPNTLPDHVSTETVSGVIDIVRWKVCAVLKAEYKNDAIRRSAWSSSDPIEVVHVKAALRMTRKRINLRAQLDRLWTEMESLNRENAELRYGNGQLTSQPGIAARIKRRAARVNEIDKRYSSLTAELKELDRRLEMGDYDRRSTARITGRPPHGG